VVFFSIFADFHTRGEAREALFISSVCENNIWIPRGYDEQLPRKPPFYYWAGCFFFKILGKNEFAARLPSILAGAFFLGIFYITLRRFKSPIFSSLSLFILSTFPAFFSLAEVARLDMLHYAALFGGWFLLLLVDNFMLSILLAAGLISISALTKGPVSIVLSGLVLGFFLTFKFEKKFLLKFLLTLFFSLIITASFYFYLVKIEGPKVLNILAEENLGRFYGKQKAVPHANSAVKIWALILLGLGVWSYLVIAEIWDRLRSVNLTQEIEGLKSIISSIISWCQASVKKASSEEFLLFSSFLIPFCFFSVSEGKRLSYFLICYPFLAYLLALKLAKTSYAQVNSFISFIKFLNILAGILLFFIFTLSSVDEFPQLKVDSSGLKFCLLASSAVNFYIAYKLSQIKQFVFLRSFWKRVAGAIIILLFSINGVGGVYLSKVLSQKKLYYWVKSVNVKNLPVYSAGYEFYGLKFYGLPISSFRIYYKRPFLILTTDKNLDQIRRYFGASQELYSRYHSWVDKPFNTPVLILAK